MRMSPISPPGLSVALGKVRSGDSLHHAAEGPVGALDQPSGSGPRPAVRFRARPAPGPTTPWAGGREPGRERRGCSPPPVARDCQDHHQVCLLRVQLGLLLQDRVLEGVLPALGELLLTALDPVGVGDPLAGVGMADGVVEDVEVCRLKTGRAMNSPSFFRSTICRSLFTSLRSSPGDWARAAPPEGTATAAAASSAAARVRSRLALPPTLTAARRTMDGTVTSSPPCRWGRDDRHRVWRAGAARVIPRKGFHS